MNTAVCYGTHFRKLLSVSNFLKTPAMLGFLKRVEI